MLNWRFVFGLSCVLYAAAAQAQVYTCTTASGRKITADRPIAECADREQRELNTGTGRVTIIKAKQTEAERWAAQDEKKKAEQEKESALQQQRRDQLLLVRYPDEAALEEKRNDMLQDVKRRWAPTLNEQAEIEAQRKAISADAEARRRAGKAPDYSRAKEAVQLERRTLQLRPLVEKAQAAIDQVNHDMDADLARLRELRSLAQQARALSLGQSPSPSSSTHPPQ